jgi:hypothetical protein
VGPQIAKMGISTPTARLSDSFDLTL